MFNKLDKEILDIAEAAKKVMAKEAEVRPGEKSTEKMVKDHPITKKDDPEQDPKNAKGVEYKIKGMRRNITKSYGNASCTSVVALPLCFALLCLIMTTISDLHLPENDRRQCRRPRRRIFRKLFVRLVLQ